MLMLEFYLCFLCVVECGLFVDVICCDGVCVVSVEGVMEFLVLINKFIECVWGVVDGVLNVCVVLDEWID